MYIYIYILHIYILYIYIYIYYIYIYIHIYMYIYIYIVLLLYFSILFSKFSKFYAFKIKLFCKLFINISNFTGFLFTRRK